MQRWSDDPRGGRVFVDETNWGAFGNQPCTVNYRYNVTDGTLKKLRYIRFYVIPVLRNFCKNTQNCVISVYRYKGGQPPHRGLIAEKRISPLSEEIFSSNFQH